MQREYVLEDGEYIPESLEKIAGNVFISLPFSELKITNSVEQVDDVPISLLYTFQDSVSE